MEELLLIKFFGPEVDGLNGMFLVSMTLIGETAYFPIAVADFTDVLTPSEGCGPTSTITHTDISYVAMSSVLPDLPEQAGTTVKTTVKMTIKLFGLIYLKLKPTTIFSNRKEYC